MRKGWLVFLVLGVLAVVGGPQPGVAPLRELHVPFEEMRRILAGSPNAVLLPRAQYEELRAAATRSRGSDTLQSAVLGSADCKVELRERVASFRATLVVTVLANGLHAVPLRTDGMDLLAVVTGDHEAPLWRDGDRLYVLVSGKGEHTVSVAGLLPVQADSARQTFSLSLPEATTTRLRVLVPGDVELKSGGAVLRQEYVEKDDRTELELVPSREPMTVVLSRNHRQRRSDAILDASSVQIVDVHEDGETLRAQVSLHLPHGSVRSLRFSLPDGMAVTAVEGTSVAQWSTAEGVLEVLFRGELSGQSELVVSGLRAGTSLGEWRFPAIRPVGVLAHAAMLGVLLEDRLEVRGMASRGLMPMRPERLAAALGEQGGGNSRLVALYYAPQADFGMSATVVKPAAAFRVGGNHLLTVSDTGLFLSSSFVVSPEYERVFSVDVLLPADWQVTGVMCGEARVPFESVTAAGGSRVRVTFPQGARLGEDTRFSLTARLVPADWVGEWQAREVVFPTVRVAGAREETGALAVVGVDDHEAEATVVTGLAALDMQERGRYGLGGLGEGALVFRFENPEYSLRTTVLRRSARLTGETLSFFVVGEESLRCHYELNYTVRKARVRELVFSVPDWTPAALQVVGLGSTTVKEYSSTEADGMRCWTVRLDAPVAGAVRVGVDMQTTLPSAEEPALPLPVLDGVAYQSGRLAVEAEADLDVRVTAHPRPVDIGELATHGYTPGARLLGSYGFVGAPAPVRVSVARHAGYPLSPVLVERLRVTSVFGTSGRGQHAAEYRLRSKLRLLEIQMPPEAELWSVLADGLPLKPLRGQEGLLFELPAGAVAEACSLLVVYETPARRLGLRGTLEAVPPNLVLRGEGGGAVPVPSADLEWVVHLPADYRVGGTSGTVTPVEGELVVPAAVQVGGMLYRATGGVSPKRGLISGFLWAGLASARQKARLMSKLAEEKEDAMANVGLGDETVPAGLAKTEEASPERRGDVQELSLAATPPGLRSLKGARSLEIALSGGEGGHVFRSLGSQPHLVVRVLDQRRLRGICWAMAAAVFGGGVYLTLRPRRQKVRYVLAVLVVAGLLPALPGLVGLALVLNSAFYAAVCLVPYYIGVRVVRRCWRVLARAVVLEARLAGLVVALLVSFSALAQEGTRAMEIVKPQPMALPRDAILVPCDPDGVPRSEVLVPVAHFAELENLAAPPAPPSPAEPYGVGGTAYTGLLDGPDRLTLKGGLAIAVYVDEAVFVPLDLRDTVVVAATLDGKPASLAFAPTKPQVAQMAQMAQRRVPNSPTVGVVVSGKGRHALALELRAVVASEGGWEGVRARLPGSGAGEVALTVPGAGTEVVPSVAGVPRSLVTKAAGEKVRVPLGRDGSLCVRWRPKTSEAAVDPTLTARSVVELVVLESQVRVSWEVELAFRRGQRDLFTFSVPGDSTVERVVGDNVRAWQTTVSGDSQTVTVTALKPAERGEKLTLLLRRDGVGGAAADQPVALPVLRAEGAVRHTARLVVRHSPLLELRTTEMDPRARRQDVAEGEMDGPGVADSPFGLRCYGAYELAALPCQLCFAVSSLPLRPTVRVRSIVRVSRRERVLESRIEVGRLARPLHELRMSLPPDLTVRDLRTSVRAEWYVAGRELVVSLPDGVADALVLTLDGRLAGALGDVPLPRLSVPGVEEQSGELVVQADSGLHVVPVTTKGIRQITVSSCHSWLAKKQIPLARIAYRHGGEAFEGVVRVDRRPTSIVASSMTNVRVTDRIVEETSLITFRVTGGGARELFFALPESQAGADISCPLLRRKTVTSEEGLARVRLELQDEVIGEIKVLVRSDRARSEERVVAFPPRVAGQVTEERILEVENASRDEVVVDRDASVGLEDRSRGGIDSRGDAGARQSFRARSAETDPKLVLRIEKRQSVETVGARIGLAQTVLMVDNSGGFRGTQTFHVDNRTEQYLDIELPAGGALWTAQVADALVKPVAMDGSAPQLVSIPLVKTAEGDLDYTVVLKYGGRMRLPALGGKLIFPVVRVLNVAPERSQLELRLPRQRRWFRFDGTMGLVGSREQFRAGYLAYQNRQAKRLLQALSSGNDYAQQRARWNLGRLKGELQEKGSGEHGAYAGKEAEEVARTLALGERRIAEKEAAKPSVSNAAVFEGYFARQQAQVADQMAMNARNWDLQPRPAAKTPQTAPSAAEPQPRKKGKSKDANWRQGQNRALVVEQARTIAPPQTPPVPQSEGRLLPQVVFADTDGDAFRQVQAHDGFSAVVGGVVWADASGGAVVGGTSVGLASLDVDFPAEDSERWETIRLATPRGDMRVTARAVGSGFLLAVQRLAICLLAFAGVALTWLLVWLLRRAAHRGMPGLAKGLALVGLGSVFFGVFPVAGLLLLVVAVALKLKPATQRQLVAR